MTRWFLITALLTTAACGGSSPGGLIIGEDAPAFKAQVVGGGTVALEDLAGEPRVLVFWATWCQPCLAEIPILEKIETEHPGRVISIALDEGGEEDVQRFLAARPLPYPALLGDTTLFARYDGLAIPHTVVIDRDLKIVAVHRGVVDGDVLRGDLAGL